MGRRAPTAKELLKEADQVGAHREKDIIKETPKYVKKLSKTKIGR
jgi:hypothetical protein